MSTIGTLLPQIIIFMLFGVVGYVFTKCKVIDADSAKILSKLDVFLFLPATIIKSFSKYLTVENLKTRYPLLVVSVSLLTIISVIIFVAVKFVKIDELEKCVIRYSLIISNYAYIGYPICLAVFGAEKQFEMIFFCIPFSIFTYTIGFCMLTSTKENPKFIELKRLKNPLVFSIIIGTVLGLSSSIPGISVPSAVTDVFTKFLELASSCMGPVSMVLAGIIISQYSLKELLGDWKVYVVVFIKILVLPLIGAFVLSRSEFTKIAIIPAVLVLSMPCGLNSVVIPKMNGNNSKIGASLIFISTVFCVVTIPLVMTVLEFFMK